MIEEEARPAHDAGPFGMLAKLVERTG